MGKQGPCYHCGVTSTPLWRNGPPEKPVLCNACGSRWRTKGTLVNYTPLHARAEPDDYEDHRVSRMKSMSINKNKEVKLVKRKQHLDRVVIGADYSHGFRKVVDEDTKSNRSSSGSAISNSESCAHFGSADASDLTGPAQSMVWDSTVPSRKRTCVGRPKQSSVEKLTKDLYTILHEQQSSYFSGSSEEDLLFESEAPMVSVEIGHGSVLIRHPSYIAREEESEASSLSVDNRRCQINEAYSHSASLLVHNNKGVNMSSTVIGKMNNPARQGMQQESLKRDKSQHDNFQILGNHNSPLCHIELHDILNYEEFMKQLSNEEQQQLVKHLPAVDVKFPYSLRSMFGSPQFAENLTSFQQLLAEGIFDISLPGAKTEDCKTLKRLALTNSLKSKWVERYHLIKKCKATTGKSVVSGSNFTTSSSFRHIKRLRDSETQSFQDTKIVMKSPKRVIMKGGYENKDIIDYEGSCFSPRSLFALPSDSSSLMMDSMSFIEESSDQDLLLDIPSNGFYPQAELLHPALTFGSQQASTSSSSVYPHPLHP